MAPLGFLGGPVPEQYGGIGVDFVSHAIITEEVGRADSSVRTTLSVQISLVELTILKFGTEEQKQRYLPRLCRGDLIGCFGLTEPEVGSDATKLHTTAKRDGSDWILSGHKMWISNGNKSGLAIIFAQTDAAKAHKGIAAFLVDRAESPYGSGYLHGKLGLQLERHRGLHVESVRVPANALLGEVGRGFTIAMAALDAGRYSVAAGAVGIAQACIDASVKYAARAAVVRQADRRPPARARSHRRHGGGDRGRQAPRLRAGDLRTRAAPARARRASRSSTRARSPHAPPMARSSPQATASPTSSRSSATTATPGEPAYEGTTQIQKLIIGRFATGIDAFS